MTYCWFRYCDEMPNSSAADCCQATNEPVGEQAAFIKINFFTVQISYKTHLIKKCCMF